MLSVGALAVAFLFWPGQAFPASVIGLVALFPFLTLWAVAAWPVKILLALVLRVEMRSFAYGIPLFGLLLAVAANVAWLAMALPKN